MMNRRDLAAVVLWLGALAGATAALLPFRDRLDKAHVSLLLLLVVLGASATAGRFVGLALAAASFLVFNWFFLPPYHTFVIADPLDWLVLVTFLVTGVVAAQLLYLAQQRALAERERAEEIDRLATLGAESLSAGSAVESLESMAATVLRSTGASRCEVFAATNAAMPAAIAGRETEANGNSGPDLDASLVAWVLTHGNAAVEQVDGTTHLHGSIPSQEERGALRAGSVRALLLPLRARGGIVGVLRIAAAGGLGLDESRIRFLHAISFYVALALERVRLVAEGERAEALRRASRLKDSLLASVSHDLRTPLTAIKALAHDIRHEAGDDRAETIEQEADRLERSVADLLDLSRLNAGELPVRLEINAVDDLLGAVVQRVERLTGSRLVVRLPSDGSILAGRFDFVHSLRILVNLVENAAKYSPAESSIELVAEAAGSDLSISVLDHGDGISAAEADRVFEEFYRSPGAPPESAGLGLGLSIARQLAHAQGGSLSHRSRDGGGSVFELRLPRVDVESPIEANPRMG